MFGNQQQQQQGGQQYDNEMRGVLFEGKNKKSEKSPDCYGSVQINGVEYRLSGWAGTSARGVNYIKLQVSLDQQPQQRGFVQQAPPQQDGFAQAAAAPAQQYGQPQQGQAPTPPQQAQGQVFDPVAGGFVAQPQPQSAVGPQVQQGQVPNAPQPPVQNQQAPSQDPARTQFGF